MVKIKTIHLDDDESPVTVVAELTIEEAAWISEKTGQETGSDDATSGLYNALTGSVFNRFWNDGVDGYRRGDDE